MTQGFTPYSGGSYGKSPGGFSPAGAGPSFGPTTGGTTRATARAATSQPVSKLLPSLLTGIVGLVINAVLQFGDHVATDRMWGLLAMIAWAVAGVIGVTLLGGYFTEVNKRRGAGYYSTVGWRNTVAWVTYGTLLFAIIWSAFNIAQWVGKW